MWWVDWACCVPLPAEKLGDEVVAAVGRCRRLLCADQKSWQLQSSDKKPPHQNIFAALLACDNPPLEIQSTATHVCQSLKFDAV